MTLRFHTAAVALGFMAFSASAHAQGIDYSKISIVTTQLAPSVYVLTGSPNVDPGHPEGAGGRIGVLVGPDGVLMVDAQYAPLGDKVLAAIRKLSNAPIRFLIDTHEHPDHTGGNPTFAKLGATIFAREETREELAVVLPPPVVKAIGDAADFTDPTRLPSVTYGLGSSVKIYLDGETVDLIPVAASHTDGDTIVRFEQADVMMIGDFYRNYGYPFVDPSHGGTIRGVLSAIDQTLALAGPGTILAPGHGSVVTRDRLGGYRKMIADMIDKVQAQIDAGNSLKQVLAAKLTAPYDASVPGGLDVLPAGLGTSADRFVGEIFAELSGHGG
jgi:glyoxylase-like metal-dependent hydrolase (beta-lactamase superfamily II)